MAEYYWCLRHGDVEEGPTTCRADDRMGPYATAEAAREWRDTVSARDAEWQADDERWVGAEEDEEAWG